MRFVFESMNKNRESAKTTRERVLAVACELFADTGFHGTHLREICKRAETNLAGVSYHFHSKEELYQAVVMEAGRQLSELDNGFDPTTQLPPEQRLQALTESLLQRLGVKRAWIAKLLTRELVDHDDNAPIHAATRLERDFVLFQAVMRELLGPNMPSDVVRLQALTLIGECVFYSLTRENPRHPLRQFTVTPPTPLLAWFLTQRSLGALRPTSALADRSTFQL
jgi:AcrR family transcriptional regulator